MTNQKFTLSKNALERVLDKSQKEFTKADIIKFIEDESVEMINFLYAGGDGRIKTLNFVIDSKSHLDSILTYGERVDGSSLFDHIDSAASDLYVLPRFNTAFLDPFSEIKTIDMLCSFFDKDGAPLDGSPQNILRKACDEFTRVTGLNFHAMGELEYYVIGEADELFPTENQKGYHESSPFSKFSQLRMKCMLDIASTGGNVKYGHSEVGCFTEGGKLYEQNEIEFLPVEACNAADQIVLAKWIIRTNAAQRGLCVTFAPKITVGEAGSGLHIHMRFMKNGENMMAGSDGKLSEIARRGIGGMMEMARSLTAFGNTIPTSYFRLVPNQEAPTNVCWGDRNRSVLVRVPLGWAAGVDMCHSANPLEAKKLGGRPDKQTVEIRSGDSSADIYQYMAAIAVACRRGWETEDALKRAEKTYVDTDIHRSDKLYHLETLPRNCAESADALEKHREIYEKYGIFPSRVIDSTLRKLRGYKDNDLATRAAKDAALVKDAVKRWYHCG